MRCQMHNKREISKRADASNTAGTVKIKDPQLLHSVAAAVAVLAAAGAHSKVQEPLPTTPPAYLPA